MNGKILLVDDEAQIRNVLKRLLQRRLPGLEVVEAESAERALDVAQTQTFDIILTDYRMDGATGAELLRRFTQDWPDTARILATGYQDDALIEEALRGLELAARLPKPWDNERVIALLTGILEKRPHAARAPSARHGGR